MYIAFAVAVVWLLYLLRSSHRPTWAGRYKIERHVGGGYRPGHYYSVRENLGGFILPNWSWSVRYTCDTYKDAVAYCEACMVAWEAPDPEPRKPRIIPSGYVYRPSTDEYVKISDGTVLRDE